MRPNKQMIIALLAQSQLAQAEGAILALHGTGELQSTQTELKSLEDIYSMRAKIAAKRGSRLEGWEQLLSGLNQELLIAGPTGKARIWYSDPGVVPIIFTDQPATKVLGVLGVRNGQTDPKDTTEFLNELGHGGI